MLITKRVCLNFLVHAILGGFVHVIVVGDILFYIVHMTSY